MKKIFFPFFLCLTFLLLFLPFGAEEKPIAVPLSGINVTREEDYLVLYRNQESTGTNEWGYEVVCDGNGTVLDAGGNDSAIPGGGFVLSGHGTMRDFLEENVVIGDIIVILEDEMTAVITEDGQYSPFTERQISFDGVNDTRSTDTVILYKDRKTTGTNQYGYEIVCDRDGYAVFVGGNNNTVPEGGFVLSGHGAGADTLRTVKLGSRISYDLASKTVTVKYLPESLKKATEIALDGMKSDYAAAKAGYRDVMYDKMEAAIAETEELLAQFDSLFTSGDTIVYREKAAEIARKSEDFRLANTESPTVETRGIWLRPTETTYEEVEKKVLAVRDAKLNTIYIETYYSGYTICLTRPGDILQQNPVFGGFDVLQAYIDICHREGISLQLWNTCFHAGNPEKEGTLANSKPEWLALSKSGSPAVETSEGTMYFINPVNREATAYLLDFYSYVLSTYDIDGIQLDYIRYGEGNDPDGYGYNDDACEAFAAAYGTDPHDITKNGNLWEEWCAFRAGYVTDFLLDVKALVAEKRPDILLSADLFPDLDNGATTVMQNSPLWMSEGYLDAAFPMSYEDDGVYENSLKASSYCGEHCYNLIGTAIYKGFSVGTVISLVEEARRGGADGFTWFEFSHLVPDGYAEAAKTTVLRNPAIRQSEGLTAFTAQIDGIADWLDRILVPFGGMEEEEAKTLKEALSSLKETAGSDLYANREATAAALKELTYKTLDENASAALEDKISRVIKTVNLSKPDFTAEFQPKPESSKDETPLPEEPAADPEEKAPAEKEEKKSQASGLPVVIGAGIVLAVGGVMLLLRKKRKK